MKKIESSIIINAPVEKVWQILTDFIGYPDWNPFISKIEGSPVEGSKLKNTMNLEQMKPQVFTPTILKVENQKEFRWLGHMFFKGLFDGEHYFLLKNAGLKKTELIHGEHFSGILAWPILKMISRQTANGFEAMNKALKQKAEADS